MAVLSCLMLHAIAWQGPPWFPYVVLRCRTPGLLTAQVDDNQFPVVRNQPLPHPTPVPTPETECCEMAWKEEDCSNARRPQPSGKRKAAFEAASRRPLISAPSNFRHLHSGSSHLGRFRSPLQLQPCFAHHEPLVRPLDRGILCVPEGQVTLHMDLGGVMTPPPPAYMARHLDGDDHELLAQSNFSPLSFHVPRRRVTATCTSIDGREGLTPRVPPRAQGRARPYTAPQMEAIKERVASAMIEAERLQQQIDEIMERQSFYANSRPSTPHPIARGAPGKTMQAMWSGCRLIRTWHD